MRSREPLARVYALILLTALLWGATAVAGKLVVRDIAPFTAGVLRYGLAGVLLVAIFRRQLPDPRSLARRDLVLLLWVGLLGTFLNHAFFFSALRFAPAAHGALIPSTASALSTNLVAARVGGDRLPSGFVVGMLLCVAGVALLVQPGRLAVGVGRATLLGDILFFLGGSCWGIYSYVSKVTMERLSNAATLTYGILIGTALLIPVALLEQPWPGLAAAGAQAWGGLGYLAVGATVLAFLWWNVGLRRVGAGRTAVFTNLVPLSGVLLSWLILGERLAPLQLLGGVLAVSGVVVCQGPEGRGHLRQAIGGLLARALPRRRGGGGARRPPTGAGT
ncbi:MAG: DMT family transporter [Candidatus Rokubacteria bacterium]|nr:DMT family transporter [Candidatus Rokubacteria bacterium]